MKSSETRSSTGSDAERRKRVSEAGQRALAEATERRNNAGNSGGADPVEKGGRPGLEPTRFGDWEKDGIASDF